MARVQCMLLGVMLLAVLKLSWLTAQHLVFKQRLLAAQVQGQKAYVTKSTEPPVNLAAYKHAKAKWDGTDNGAFEAWVHDTNFAPLSSYS